MSTNLYWKPKQVNHGTIGLKYILANRLWNSDGSLSEPEIIVNENLIPFLEGLKAGSGSGDYARESEKLINLIKKHKEIVLYIG